MQGRSSAHDTERALPHLELLLGPICTLVLKNLSSVQALRWKAPAGPARFEEVGVGEGVLMAMS